MRLSIIIVVHGVSCMFRDLVDFAMWILLVYDTEKLHSLLGNSQCAYRYMLFNGSFYLCFLTFCFTYEILTCTFITSHNSENCAVIFLQFVC